MAKSPWPIYFLVLICVSSMSDAFVRQKRLANEQETKPLEETVPAQSEEIEKVKDDTQDPSHVRKRRQWNTLESAIQEIFPAPIPDQNRFHRNAYPYQQPYYLNNYNQPQTYNKFPVYGPPSYQPSNFIPNPPVINNHYLPYRPPFYCCYSVVIRLPNYPQPVPPVPTDTNPEEMPTIGDRFNNPDNNRPRPEVDPNAYNNTLTGISLDVIKPVREPSITPPPIQRPGEGPVQGPPGRPEQTPRPQFRPTQPPIQQRPTQRTTTRRPPPPLPPQNSFRPAPGNSVAPSYPIYYPEDGGIGGTENSVSQNFPSEEDEGPSACVKAIVWCCVPNRARRIPRERCFEINGCPGAFFDGDPCDTTLAVEAIRATNQYQRRG